MDIKKQPKPWYIRYRYPILSGAAGIAIGIHVRQHAIIIVIFQKFRQIMHPVHYAGSPSVCG